MTISPDGQLIGRGSSDDKGPVLGWVNVLQYHFENKKELPVNFRCCFEGMEENGSEGLDDLVAAEAKPGGFFEGVDCVCIVRLFTCMVPGPYMLITPQSDNYWLNTRTPALTYGLRGITYWQIEISGPARDLHSGVFGRTVHEPMTDLILVMSKLVDTRGNILIPGIDDMVSIADAEERSVVLLLSLDSSFTFPGQYTRSWTTTLPISSNQQEQLLHCPMTRSRFSWGE